MKKDYLPLYIISLVACVAIVAIYSLDSSEPTKPTSVVGYAAQATAVLASANPPAPGFEFEVDKNEPVRKVLAKSSRWQTTEEGNRIIMTDLTLDNGEVVAIEGGTVGDVTLTVSDTPMPKVGANVRVKKEKRNQINVVDQCGAEDYTLKGYKWTSMPVKYYVDPTNGDAQDEQTVIEDVVSAANAWWQQSQARLTTQYAGVANSPSVAYDNRNNVFFSPQCGGSTGTIATAYHWSSGGSVLDFDIVFWDGCFKVYTSDLACSGGIYILDVATHEFGHGFGLGHSTVSGATMSATIGWCSSSPRSLAADDIAGIEAVYGTGQMYGNITISSTPSGANAYVDSLLVGTTPVTAAGVAEGTHPVRVSYPGYCDYVTNVNVLGGTTTSVNAVLSGAGQINATSVPAGASVYVDGSYKGETPILIPAVCGSGSHSVLFSLANYMDYQTSINVEVGKTTSVNAVLVPSGALQVTADVSRASVYVDGALIGTAPITINKIATGSHSVKVSKKRYTDYTTTVNILQGQLTTVDAVLGGSTNPGKGRNK